MGYSFYYPSEYKMIVAWNAEFFKNSLISQEASGSYEDLEEIQDEMHILMKTLAIITMRSNMKMLNHKEHGLGDHGEPTNYKAALSKSGKWLEAMNVEMQSKKDNEVWSLIDLQSNAKTVGRKWFFKKKADMHGNLAIRILLAIATFYDYEIWQMDVKTAFLNGHLTEEVYMVQPEGFVNPKYPNRVCKLQRLSKHQGAGIKGEASYILGIKIYKDRSKRLIGFCQSADIEKILERFNMENSKRGRSIMYANLRECHWTVVKNILKYLKNTEDMFLFYGGDFDEELRVTCVIDWKSAKQSTTAMSSSEAEYIAASEAIMRAIWIRKFINGLGVVPTNLWRRIAAILAQ
ncbi:retrotransposon protein, putative, ty1-copia subclass [Tanacetum coccineum]